MDLSEFLKLWRVEKGSSQLAQLPEGFYAKARELLKAEDSYEAKKAKGVFDDLLHMRQHKLLMGCLRELEGGSRPENLLGVEKEVYRRILDELRAMRSGEATVEAVEAEELGGESETGQEFLSSKGDGGAEAAEEEEGPEGAEKEEGEKPEEEEESGEGAGGSGEPPEKAPETEAGGSGSGEEKEPREPAGKTEAAAGKDADSETAPEEPAEPAGKAAGGAEKEPAKAAKGEKEGKEGKPEAGGPGSGEEKGLREPAGKQGGAGPEKAEQKAGERKEEKAGEEDGSKEVFKEGAENKALKRVRFLKSMPAFVGPDLETLGPFEEDQVVELDEDVAEVLLKNDAVEPVR